MEGELRNQQLVSALRSIGRNRTTGILTVQGPEEIIAFSFFEGAIVGADALNQSLEHGLGEVLASQELVDRSEFAGLLAEHEAGGGRVLDLLIERSYLDRDQLLDAMRRNTYRLCLEALSWQEGEYRFFRGDEVAFEAGVEAISVGELLVRSSRDLGGIGPLPLPVPEPEDIFESTSGSKSLDEVDGALESALGRRLFEAVDGARTLEETAAEAHAEIFDILDLASELQQMGLIAKVGSRAGGVDGGERARRPPRRTQSPEPERELSAASSSEAAGAEPRRSAAGEKREAGFEADSAWMRTPGERPRVRFDWKGLQSAMRWLHRALGLGILAVTVVLLITGPMKVVFPFPWQEALRVDFRAVQRSVQKTKISHAADVFFLLLGRYPESSAELQSLGLVTDDDLRLRGGGAWDLTASPASYVLTVHDAAGSPREDASWTSSVAGNFLLDPDFVRPSSSLEGPLLVLLD
jgi:hypothetical protein